MRKYGLNVHKYDQICINMQQKYAKHVKILNNMHKKYANICKKMDSICNKRMQ